MAPLGNGNDGTGAQGAGGMWGKASSARGPSPRFGGSIADRAMRQLLDQRLDLGMAKDGGDEAKQARGKGIGLTAKKQQALQDVATRFGDKLPGGKATAELALARIQELTWLGQFQSVMADNTNYIRYTIALRAAELADQYDTLLADIETATGGNPQDGEMAEIYVILKAARDEAVSKAQQGLEDSLRTEEKHTSEIDDLKAQLAASQQEVHNLKALFAQRPSEEPASDATQAAGKGKGKKAKSAQAALPGRRKTPRGK